MQERQRAGQRQEQPRGLLLHERLLSRRLLLKGCTLQFLDTRVAGYETLAKLLVFLVETSQLHDDLVEKVIDFILVVALTELRRLEPLIDHIFWSQSHCLHLKNFLSTST